jgi:hypothetical protein
MTRAAVPKVGLDQLPVPTAAFEGLRRSSSIPA